MTKWLHFTLAFAALSTALTAHMPMPAAVAVAVLGFGGNIAAFAHMARQEKKHRPRPATGR